MRRAALAALILGTAGPAVAEATLLDFADLDGWEADDHAAALAVFLETCDLLDAPDWRALCALAATAQGPEGARSVFEALFRPVLIEDGTPALLTAYYEPELDGSRTRTDRFGVPLYALPPDAPPEPEPEPDPDPNADAPPQAGTEPAPDATPAPLLEAGPLAVAAASGPLREAQGPPLAPDTAPRPSARPEGPEPEVLAADAPATEGPGPGPDPSAPPAEPDLRPRARGESAPVPPGSRRSSRADIMRGALAGQGLEIAWVEDPVEAFFLQVQGSGRIRLPDGSLLRLGYAGSNGREYTSIGRALVARGALEEHQLSAEAIRAWVARNPEAAPGLLGINESYVYFREVSEVPPERGPIGAMGRSVTAGRTVAVDPALVPLGAPVWVERRGEPLGEPLGDGRDASAWAAGAGGRLMVAQDTGSAIKGAQRADLFLGTGPAAGRRAGRVRDPGRLVVLLPIQRALALQPETVVASADASRDPT